MSESAVEVVVETEPQPTLRTLESGLRFSAPSGRSVELRIEELVQRGDPAELLAWANFLVQKDVAQQLAAQAEATRQLAQAIGQLQSRAQATDPSKLMREALDQVGGLVQQLMRVRG